MAITNSAVIDIDMQVSLYIVCPYTLQTYTQEWYNWVYYAYLEDPPSLSPQFVFPAAV